MDRTLKVFAPTGHFFAEFTFHYDMPRQATGHYTRYNRLYRDDEEDENKSVFPGISMDLYLHYREFASIDEVKTHDRQLVEKELGRDMTAPASYTYVYEADPVLLRYVAENHLGAIGMIDVRFSFINNTKEVKFRSASNPRFDFDLSSHSLETNISCIQRIPLYTDREVSEINLHDLKRLEPWY